MGVARRNGKFSIFDVRRLGGKAVSVCEETFHWEMNKFLFVGEGESVVASYGHLQGGGFKVLNVCSYLNCAVRPALLTRGSNKIKTVISYQKPMETLMRCPVQSLRCSARMYMHTYTGDAAHCLATDLVRDVQCCQLCILTCRYNELV